MSSRHSFRSTHHTYYDMADQNPFSWSIDQVVDQVCSRSSYLYTQLPPIKPVVDLEALETAFRQNDIDGESLLSLEDANVKDDLGISSFGQRREVRKIVQHLRAISVTYSSAGEPPKRRHSQSELSSPGRTPEVENQPKKRRIQPENLSNEPLSTVPQEFDPALLDNEWQAFLLRHQEDSEDEILRPYNESDIEKEIDSDDSLNDDLSESDSQDIVGARLKQDEVDTAINEAIQEYQDSWKTDKRPKKHKTAHRRWMQAARAGTRKPQQNALQEELARLHTRLTKLRLAVADPSMDYHKVEEVKRNCMNLQVTVENISEQGYYLEVLSSDVPPIVLEQQMPLFQRPQLKPEETLADGEEIIDSSEDEEDARDVESGDAMSIASNDDSSVSLSYDPTDDWNPKIPAPETFERIPSPSRRDSAYDETMTDVTLQMPGVLLSAQQPYDSDQFHAVSDEELALPGALPSSQHTVPLRTKTEMPTGYARQQTPMEAMEEEDSDLDRPRLPQSRYRTQGATIDTAISLGSSPSGSEHSVFSNVSVRTPPLNPVTPTKFKQQPPQYPPVQELRSKKWQELGGDPFLCLCKAVYRRDRESASNVLREVSQHKDIVEERLRSIIAEIQDDEDVDDTLEEDPAHIWALYFMVYITGRNLKHPYEVSDQCLDMAYEATEEAARFNKILKALLQHYILTGQANNGPGHPHDLQQTLPQGRAIDRGLVGLPGTTGALPRLQSYQQQSLLTDTETEEDEPPRSGGRRRPVQQSQEALTQQRDDRYRVHEQEQRRQEIMQRIALASSADVQPVPINTVEPFVYLDQHIARRVKEHQIEGIQFIWRELIMDPKHQGCLLAHTMGLGKTMQVISFLVALAQANQSGNAAITDMIPPHLRNSKKVLVVCPASLVDNWFDEILMWTPPEDPGLLGGIYKISGLRKDKIRKINEWNAAPGILIISYESLKTLLNEKRSSPEDFAALEQSLLEDPCVVIADEAHKLKNAKSTVNKVASSIKTPSRIALTGSPLNNHLEEYHTMINWIAPNYLGTLVQFRDKYSEPIQQGLYADSSRYEKRKSLEKLYVLKRDLAPKIDRKDISAIEKDMPQKTEFFITVPLTELQKEIYEALVQHIIAGITSDGKATKSGNAQLWKWLSILSWLCNHPSCLIRKLQEKNQEGFQAAILADGDDDVLFPADMDLHGSSIEDLLPKFLDSFRAIGMLNQLDDPVLSTRAMVTRYLIEESVAQGEKILVFSHSIPTLNFLQGMLEDMDCGYLRIDGSTAAGKRQNATKYFNEQDNDIHCFLISTRAGGLGLNLQGANRVIIYDFGFNPSWEEQAVGRAYRLGQKKAVFVYKFRAGGTFEDAIHNKSIFKTQLFSRVVDQKNVVRHASKKIEDYIFIPKDIEPEDLTGFQGKDVLLDRIIAKAPDAIRSLTLTETFQREDEEDLITNEEKEAWEKEVEMERLRRTNPQEYNTRVAAREQREAQARDRRFHQATTASPYFGAAGGQLHDFGGPGTQFAQVWNTNTIYPGGRQAVPVRDAAQASSEASEMLRTPSSTSGEGTREAPGCANQ